MHTVLEQETAWAVLTFWVRGSWFPAVLVVDWFLTRLLHTRGPTAAGSKVVHLQLAVVACEFFG
jgi:hypothetical protein